MYLRDETKNLLPDIIFLDQNMPGNSGNECLREIKKIARVIHIPVIIYTTGGNPILYDVALKLGAYKYIIKATHPEEILRNLSAIIAECENSKIDST